LPYYITKAKGKKMKILKYISTIVLGLITSKNLALGQSTFAKAYGGSGHDISYSVQQTNDGGFIIAGWTNSFGAGGWDFLIIKTDTSGNIKWAKTYGGMFEDYAHCIQQTSDEGFIVVGYKNDFYAIKIDSIGNIQWAKTYGKIEFFEYAYNIQHTNDNGFVLTGIKKSYELGTKDVLLIKLDSEGNIKWAKIYEGKSDDESYSVQQTNDGGFIMAGWTNSFGSGGWDFLLIKTDASGNIQWAKTYEGEGDELAYSVQQTSDGGFLVTGYTSSFGSGGWDFLLIKTDASGNIQWAKTYGGDNLDRSYSAQITRDGGFIVSGYTYSFGESADILLIKTDATGNIQWAKIYGGSRTDISYSVNQTRDNGYVISGYTSSFGSIYRDFILIKTDGNGDLNFCSIVKSVTPTVNTISLSISNPTFSTSAYDISAEDALPITTVTSPTISISEICPLTSVPSESSTPLQFKLLQNYPNPFNSTTTIPFWLPQRTNVILKVYDVFGREIATLINREFDAGEHSIQFNANDLPTGVYFYRLQAGNFIEQKKMILIK
jgi:hypothetical protein